jgi:hypothetical protein
MTMIFGKKNILFAVLFLVVVGCGGTSGPEAACQDFINTVCARGATCNIASASECRSAFNQSIKCGAVKSIRDEDEFAQCLVEIGDFPCDEIESRLLTGDVPAVCENQLLM